jgi:hypothetical protein
MNIVNHEPIIKMFGNGMQITFPNRYSIVVKNGLGAKCTQTAEIEDAASLLMASRFGGCSGPDVEASVYDPNRKDITNKFGEPDGLGFVTPMQLVNLLYVVSSLK